MKILKSLFVVLFFISLASPVYAFDDTSVASNVQNDNEEYQTTTKITNNLYIDHGNLTVWYYWSQQPY